MPSLGSLFSLSGRTGRGAYWLIAFGQLLGVLLLVVTTGAFDPTADPRPAHPPSGASLGLWMTAGLALAWIGFAATVRRWHDRDKSAWWCFVGGIPLLGPLWVFVELGFLPGSVGSNRFGPPPGFGGGWGREPSGGTEPTGDLDAVVARWAASPAPAPAVARPAARFAAPVDDRPRPLPGRGGTFGRRGLA